ncbi:Xaa-Pro aminopeptidase [Ignavibacterium album JCM 16511]|uniref:Xaa-Pro aminopeptidase n=1 Tax=Ignavibacterium album (strain DSM 19864 / JCM 16511 / NBRC 101810 / Mat9-16) TaxID=945713 RepID=I0ANV1_IGNAJ|nr:Xaa-Pro peptidase family protein [Ignavibacterium album]AFH50658.1 Xaa-Pro aminopeptidase [Ignavibacterium album JCM 16511]
MSNQIIKEKILQAVEILNEKNIDMWITFVRETKVTKDPMIDMIVGEHSTWQSAFIINRDGETAAIVGSIEEENIVKTGLFQKVIGYVKSVKEPLLEYLNDKNPKSIAINYSKNSVLSDGLTYGMYLLLNDYLEGTEFKNRLVSAEEIISALRGRKSDSELSIMKEAITETLKIFDAVTKFIKPGLTEKDVAEYVKKIMKEKGFQPAWDEETCPAVFTGPNPASAHSGPTDRKIEKGHLVNMDFGIKYKGYCSDLQRTWYVLRDGETKAPAEVQKGFEVIRDAIQKVADAIKPGVTGVEMDDIARNYITDQGYPEYPHGLGHQVGREVHDGGAGLFPRWERYGNTPFMKLEERQVFTIEPRLPVEGFGVATIEEEVVITRDGCEFLSPPQKELILIK